MAGGTGTLFPSLGAGQQFWATIVKATNANVFELVRVIASATDSFTVQRQAGSQAWNAGDLFTLRVTAEALNNMTQPPSLQAQVTNFALDTGTINNYVVVLSPPLSQHVIGMPIRWIALSSNTGNCTFNDTQGTAPMLLSPGVQVPAGMIRGGGIYETVWDGAQFQVKPWINPALYATLAQVNPGSPVLSTVGYRFNSDGTIEQWGQVTAPGGVSTFGFPYGFAVGCFNIQFTPVGANQEVIWISATSTQFTGDFGGGVVSWRAIGR